MAAPAPAPPPPPLSHAHHTPPAHIRAVHKAYQKLPLPALATDPHMLDLAAAADTPARAWHARHLRTVGHVPAGRAAKAFQAFREAAGGGGGGEEEAVQEEEDEAVGDAAIYEHDFVPGLQLIPGLLPPRVQRALLSALLHRHLSNPAHATNLHAHHTLPYPSAAAAAADASSSSSFFALPPATPLPARNPATHTPLTAHRMLSRKLRWLTLGAQYDWTLKQYPGGQQQQQQPAFPPDVAGLITDLLPQTTAPQAAITNLYSPGDTLAPHRDVSEASRAPLVSVSVGCDAVFVIGLEAASSSSSASAPPPSPNPTAAEATANAGEVLVLRVRSGDVVVMGGASRWAWHSVPRVVAGSCPRGVAEWPAAAAAAGAGAGAGAGGCEAWRGWMAGKRVNLNVRQMWD
ncbi:oxidoreductase [Morchella snyderi]|nr:oxidoreductase [Morchella snyderi]